MENLNIFRDGGIVALAIQHNCFETVLQKSIAIKQQGWPMFRDWLLFFYVGVGGLAGAILRYWISLSLQQTSIVLPYGTLLANFIGCFAIGTVTQIAENAEALSPEARLFLATGFCGGLTTLSSMIFELARLLRDGEIFYGFVYFLATFSGGFLSFYMGILIIKMAIKQ